MLLGVSALGGLATEEARADSLEVQVNRAIERGVAKLRAYEQKNGSFNSKYASGYPAGCTALGVYTLIKSGVPTDDPQVTKGLQFLRYRPFKKTYSVGCLIMALDAHGDPAHKEWIQRAAKWLDENFHPTSKRWNYPGSNTDLSNTQYAALGLWIAEKHGFTARGEVWGGLLESIPTFQTEDGGFGYRPGRLQTGSMTVAGLTVLELALARVSRDDFKYRAARSRAKKAVAKGWEYLERRFVADANPHGEYAFGSSWTYYYLYGIERLAAIAGGRERIGTHDWYDAGARHLIDVQEKDGRWRSAHDTCFALLFLRRATFTTMDRAPRNVVGDVTAKTEEPPAKAPLRKVPFIRRWLQLGPFDNPDDALLDKPKVAVAKLAPRVRATKAGMRWRAYRSLTPEVKLGGEDGPRAKSLTYAFLYLHAAEDVDVVLWFGHEDGAVVLLDGVEIYRHHFHARVNSDVVRKHVRLAKGVHRLLFQVENVSGNHRFWFRIVRPGGGVEQRVIPSFSEKDPELAQAALAQPELFTLGGLLQHLPRDGQRILTFDTPEQLERLAFTRAYNKYPGWRGAYPEEPEKAKGPLPNPGTFGSMSLHAPWKDRSAFAYWKVRVPEVASQLRIRVSSVPTDTGIVDAVLKVGVYDGALHRLLSETIGGDKKASAENWRTLDADLEPFAGKEVLIVLEAAPGGRHGWHQEGLHFDEISIRQRR